MAVQSKSAIPLFIFLALLLLLLPCAAILWHGNRKFRERRKRRKPGPKTFQNIVQTMPTSFEMGKIRTPPVAVAPPRERTRERRQLPLAWRGPDGKFIIPNQISSQQDTLDIGSNRNHRQIQGAPAKVGVEGRDLTIPSLPPTPPTPQEPTPPTQYATVVDLPPFVLMAAPAPKREQSHARVFDAPQRRAEFAKAPQVHSQYGIPEDDVEYDTPGQTPKNWT